MDPSPRPPLATQRPGPGRRTLRASLAASAAVALLLVSAVAGLALATRDGGAPTCARASVSAGALDPRANDPRAAPAPPAATPAPAPAAPLAGAPPGDPASGGLAVNPPAPHVTGPGAAPARPDAAVPALARAMPSRARTVVSAAIAGQVPALAACFSRAPPGFARRTALDRRSFVSGRGVLRLDLEPTAGALLVHDARVDLPGNASDAELACAARALRGLALDVPGVAPGPHLTMIYPIP